MADLISTNRRRGLTLKLLFELAKSSMSAQRCVWAGTCYHYKKGDLSISLTFIQLLWEMCYSGVKRLKKKIKPYHTKINRESTTF